MYFNRFIGREAELAALRGASAAKLVTLVGPPGVGKTRLLLEHVSSFNARVLSLAKVSTEEALYRLLAQELSARDEQPSSIIEAWRGLSGLFMVDHADAFIAPLRGLLLGIYQSSTAPQIICTSRERLGLPFESVQTIRPLSAEQSLSLFIERAREAQPGFTLTGKEDALLSLLDGLPLAIELAAARVKLFSIPQLITKLSSRFQLLRQPELSLEESIASSWERLNEHERSVLLQCALFRGGFSMEAAERVIVVEGDKAPWVFDVLQSLCEKSLLSRDGERLSMLLSIREYVASPPTPSPASDKALVTLPPSPTASRSPLSEFRRGSEFPLGNSGTGPVGVDTVAAKQPVGFLLGGATVVRAVRLADYFLSEAKAREPGLYTARGEEVRSWFSTERENLAEVHRLGISQREPVWAGESVLYMARAFSGDAGYESLLALLGAALVLDGLPPVLLANLLEQRGRLLYLRGSLAEAQDDLTRAYQIATEEGERLLLANLCNRLGTYHLRTRELEEAETFLEQASSLFASLKDPHREGFCASQQALLAKKRGEYQRALRHYERSLQLRQRAQDESGVATSLLNLSYFLKGQGRLAEARLYVEQVLPLARRLGDKRLEASYLGALGAIHQEEGDLPRAIALLEESSQALQSIGKRLLSGWFLLLLGQCYHELGRLSEARQQYDAVLARRESAEPAQESYTWSYLSVLAAQEGRPREGSDALSLAERFAKSSQEALAEVVYQLAKRFLAGEKAPDEEPLSPSGMLPSMVSSDVRFMRRLLGASVAVEGPQLLIDKEARWFELAPAARVNMQQRKAPRLLLLALVAQHERQTPLSVEALFAKGWPNESAHPDAARSRVYTALNLLRSLGLQDVLLRRDDGYLLDKSLVVKII